MKLKILSSTLFLLVFQNAFCQKINSEKLDNYFNTLVQNEKFMGSVAVLKNNQIIYQKTVGFRQLETKIPNDKSTLFGIGSISKTFTATLIFKAIEEGKLNLNSSLSTFFTSIPNADKITIKNLLNHSSGIFSITDSSDYFSWSSSPISQSDMLAKIAKHPSEFEPNTKHEYSNSNYILLSYILEKVYKEDFGKILKKKIVQPLKLKNTFYNDIPKNRVLADSYQFTQNWNKSIKTDVSIPLGAGAIVSNPEDLLVFINALSNNKLISAESWKQMKTSDETYGLGIFEMPFENHYGLGHDGAIDGFKSMLTIYPEDQLSYAITSNGLNYPLNRITTTLEKAIFLQDFDVPDFSKIQVSEKELLPLLGVYSTTDLPIKLTITQENGVLYTQATGQSMIPMESVNATTFTFDKAGITLLFDIQKKTLTLQQAGREFTLNKEN